MVKAKADADTAGVVDAQRAAEMYVESVLPVPERGAQQDDKVWQVRSCRCQQFDDVFPIFPTNCNAGFTVGRLRQASLA